MRYLCYVLALLGGQAVRAQQGCTDPLANNYDPQAQVYDGSCTYDAISLGASASYTLDSSLRETSGLAYWAGRWWTHNDDTDTQLYALDTTLSAALVRLPLPRVRNIDWEDLAQDEDYFYLADVGNNSNGNRSDLKILRLAKAGLMSGASSPVIDTIAFSYADQVDFSATGANNTDFDCEALVVVGDSIYLFTKQWRGNQTKIYSLPAQVGTQLAQVVDSLPVQGLVTGAHYQTGQLVLCGYTTSFQPFLYLCYGFSGARFSAGYRRKIGLNWPLHQVEGIASIDGRNFYVSNESALRPPLVNIPAKLQRVSLDSLLPRPLPSGREDMTRISAVWRLYPNPSFGGAWLDYPARWQGQSYHIYDLAGRYVRSGQLETPPLFLSTEALDQGYYWLQLPEGQFAIWQLGQ